MFDDKITKHESFGAITFNRVSGGTYLFGSDAYHHGFIRLEISEADMRRGLSEDRHMAGRRLVTVDMSYEQFCAAIASFGLGMGTPCTLRMVAGKKYEDVPEPEHFSSKFQDDLKATVNRAVVTLSSLVTKLEESNLPGNKPLGKKEQAKVLSDIQHAIMEIKENVPFIEKQFDEMMEKKVAAALIEVEGVVAAGLRQIGLETLQKRLAAEMPEYGTAFSVSGNRAVPELKAAPESTIEGHVDEK